MRRRAPAFFGSLAMAAVVLSAAGLFGEPQRRVAVIRSSRLPLYDLALQGFRRSLSEQGMTVVTEDFLLPADPAEESALFTQLAQQKFDLLLTLGSNASAVTRDSAKGTPLVFGMTVDPFVNGLTRGGAALDVRPAEQIRFIRRNFPSLKRVGIFYRPGCNTAVVKGFKEAEGLEGASLVLIEVKDPGDMGRLLDQLRAEADCLLMVSDSILYSAQTSPQFILQTLRSGFPFIAVSPSFVKAGALAAIYGDSEDNGYQAGRAAARFLAGEDLNAIPVYWTEKAKTAFNLVVAERLRLSVSEAAKKSAELVVR